MAKEICDRNFKGKNRKYNKNIRAFALTLHFYSTKAYNFTRSAFNNLLPHPSTIQRWYLVVDGNPGFTKEALEAIKQKCSIKDVICNLVIDEMSIREHIQYQGQQYHGFVDCGTGLQSETPATNVLVFMAVAINSSWKVPVGYFFIKSLTASERANILNTALKLIHETGAICRSVTFDGAAVNISMTNILGMFTSIIV